MRPRDLSRSFLPLLSIAAFLVAGSPAGAEALAERLAGNWTCHAVEGKSENDVIMTMSYRRSGDWLIGEITEDNGAALLDVWLDNGGGTQLALRRILSYDATIEMKVVEETPSGVKLEGEMRHILSTTARVREVFRFTGNDAFRAIWEDDSGGGWHVVLDRHCERV